MAINPLTQVAAANPVGVFGVTPLPAVTLVAGQVMTIDSLIAPFLRGLQGDIQSVYLDAQLATDDVTVRARRTRQYTTWPAGTFGWQPLLVQMPDGIEMFSTAGAQIGMQVASGLVMPGIFAGSRVLSSEGVTVSRVAAATAATSLLAANVQRQGASLFNDSYSGAWVLVGAGTVSATNFSYYMRPRSTLETPYKVGAALSAIWQTANGAMAVSEYL